LLLCFLPSSAANLGLTPKDWASGHDPQPEKAVALVMDSLKKNSAARGQASGIAQLARSARASSAGGPVDVWQEEVMLLYRLGLANAGPSFLELKPMRG
jgi:hypothetical protein